MDDIPHLAWPLAINGATYAVNQQDTNAEVAACVGVIVSCPLGARDEAPDFGVADPTFSQRPIDTANLETTVELYEPRARLTVSESAYDQRDPLAVTVSMTVHVFTSEDE